MSRDAILTKHRLPPLWRYALELINSIEEDDERTTVAGELINQLHEVDEDGQKLRYDRDARTLCWNHERFRGMPKVIDISNLRHVANELFAYLEDWHSYVVDLRSYDE